MVAAGETALDLGEQACRDLFAAHPELVDRLDILVFCTHTPDHPLPPNYAFCTDGCRFPAA